jgi:hypothetical protein
VKRDSVILALMIILGIGICLMIAIGAQKLEDNTTIIKEMEQTIRAQEELLDAYRNYHATIGSLIGTAAEALDNAIYGPYSREEVQEKIAQIAEILREVNAILTPDEAEDMSQHIVRQSIAAGVDPMLVTAMAITESDCRPNVRGGSGEYGLIQIMPSTGRWIAQKLGYTDWKPEDMLDIRTNVRFAAYYLWAVTKDMGGDTWKGVLAYNAGPTGARNWLAGNDVGSHHYVRKVQATYNNFRRREEHAALNVDRRRQKSTKNPAREINPDLCHLPAAKRKTGIIQRRPCLTFYTSHTMRHTLQYIRRCKKG